MKDLPPVMQETRHLIERSKEYRKQLGNSSIKLAEAIKTTWRIVSDIRNRPIK